MKPRILIADDQADVLEALRLLLKPEGYQIDTAQSPAGAMAAAESGEYEAAIIDLNYARDTTSGQEGIELARKLHSLDPSLGIVAMTAWASIELAVEAMRQGARDFIQKPWENARVLAIVATQVSFTHALRRAQRLEAENQALRADGGPSMIASSAAMQPVVQLIQRVGPSEANVLITGEHGVGKGVVARALHAVSARSGRPLVTVNTGGLPESLFESELFGHVKGAFTDARADRVGRFEMADGGTLFLDEIANVPPSQQARLLRVLETGEFERVGSSRPRRTNVRIISATNADLAAETIAGRFREDLLFRLNTVEIHIPALRDRRDDIPVLASHFLTVQSERYRKRVHGFDSSATQALLAHPWPGNVRELEHAVERAVLMCTGDQIRTGDLGLKPARESANRLEDMTVEEVEAFLIKKALARHQGNVSHAAEALGLSRSALYRRIQRYGL